MTAEDTRNLRRAFALAAAARAAGQGAFGAVILAAGGAAEAAPDTAPDAAPLAEAGNAVASTGDPTAHAEMEAIRAAASRHGRAALAGATLYASTEPCAMCAAAAYVAGIGRVVFGLREADLPRARGGPLPWQPVQLPAAEVAARGRRPMAVEGPLLEEEEAARPHAGLGVAVAEGRDGR